MVKMNEEYKISREAKKVAAHIGLISEGAIQTLINRTRQDAVLERMEKELKEIDLAIDLIDEKEGDNAYQSGMISGLFNLRKKVLAKLKNLKTYDK